MGRARNGTVVGAELAGLNPRDLGTRTAVLAMPLLGGWLALFWRMARAAGVPGPPAEHLAEAAWLAAAACLLVTSHAAFGPEIAALAALGPLIALRFAV